MEKMPIEGVLSERNPWNIVIGYIKNDAKNVKYHPKKCKNQTVKGKMKNFMKKVLDLSKITNYNFM